MATDNCNDSIRASRYEGMYIEKLNDNRKLCEALRAVYALVGEDKQIKKIVEDAISEHGIAGE